MEDRRHGIHRLRYDGPLHGNHQRTRQTQGDFYSMRTSFVKNQYGEIKYERDNDWPDVLVDFPPHERVIYAADGKHLILQYRHRSLQNDKWSTWRSICRAKSPVEMR